jgi:hypothetical protein
VSFPCVFSRIWSPVTLTPKVFATFVVLMGSAGAVGIFGAAAPLAVNVALVGFEFLVAFPPGLCFRHSHQHLPA